MGCHTKTKNYAWTCEDRTAECGSVTLYLFYFKNSFSVCPPTSTLKEWFASFLTHLTVPQLHTAKYLHPVQIQSKMVNTWNVKCQFLGELPLLRNCVSCINIDNTSLLYTFACKGNVAVKRGRKIKFNQKQSSDCLVCVCGCFFFGQIPSQLQAMSDSPLSLFLFSFSPHPSTPTVFPFLLNLQTI